MKNKNRELKKEDVNLIRKYFYLEKILTRQELCQKTGISSGGVVNILQELLDSGEILYVSDAASTGGRKCKQYVLNPDHAHIGMVNCIRRKEEYFYELHVFTGDGKELSERKETSENGSSEDLQNCLNFLINSDSLIRIVVISIPGFCEKGVVQLCDFHELEGKNLKKMIPFGTAGIIENDVNVACIGMYHERKYQNMAFIYQPDAEYSGTGLVIHGRLYNGSHHRAGEMRYLYQNQPVQNLQNPALQLWNEICAVQAVADPEVIGWCSTVTSEKDLMKYAQGEPVNLISVRNLNPLIVKGLYSIGKDYLMNNRQGEEE